METQTWHYQMSFLVWAHHVWNGLYFPSMSTFGRTLLHLALMSIMYDYAFQHKLITGTHHRKIKHIWRPIDTHVALTSKCKLIWYSGASKQRCASRAESAFKHIANEAGGGAEIKTCLSNISSTAHTKWQAHFTYKYWQSENIFTFFRSQIPTATN